MSGQQLGAALGTGAATASEKPRKPGETSYTCTYSGAAEAITSVDQRRFTPDRRPDPVKTAKLMTGKGTNIRPVSGAGDAAYAFDTTVRAIPTSALACVRLGEHTITFFMTMTPALGKTAELTAIARTALGS